MKPTPSATSLQMIGGRCSFGLRWICWFQYSERWDPRWHTESASWLHERIVPERFGALHGKWVHKSPSHWRLVHDFGSQRPYKLNGYIVWQLAMPLKCQVLLLFRPVKFFLNTLKHPVWRSPLELTAALHMWYSWYNLVKPRFSTSQFGMVRLGIPTRFYIGFTWVYHITSLSFFVFCIIYCRYYKMCAVVTAGARSVDVVDRMSSWARSKCRPQKPLVWWAWVASDSDKKKLPSWQLIHDSYIYIYITNTFAFAFVYNYNYIYIACTYLEFFSSWSSSIEFVYRLKLLPLCSLP